VLRLAAFFLIVSSLSGKSMVGKSFNIPATVFAQSGLKYGLR